MSKDYPTPHEEREPHPQPLSIAMKRGEKPIHPSGDIQVILEKIKWDEKGLVPAIVQDVNTKQVLMMAYMNAESLRQTFEIGETVFWSRSRGEFWHKGATSGNTQKVREIYLDCDGDTLLVMVEPAGPACHTGAVSCFFTALGTEF
jgi:phosphoribosyl-AMP cyclohydrolase